MKQERGTSRDVVEPQERGVTRERKQLEKREAAVGLVLRCLDP